jgi:hypothetical protein
MKIHFPQQADVWRVRGAPRQIVLRSLPLMEETWELSADEAGNPVHRKDWPPESRLAWSSIATESFT